MTSSTTVNTKKTSISDLSFIGQDLTIPLADGGATRRVHLDAAASPLPLKSSQASLQHFLPYYSNTHSKAHFSARISTDVYEWAKCQILSCLNVDPAHYSLSFSGFGSTAVFNRIARGLSSLRTTRRKVIISVMEHHSNDLPHRTHHDEVIFAPVVASEEAAGTLDIAALRAIFEKNPSSINYICISGLSNVTGICNPISMICELAHQYGAYVVMDAAQYVPSLGLNFNSDDLLNPDFCVFSGHKVYTPNAPGVLIAKISIIDALPSADIGGGVVKEVTSSNFELLPPRQREHAGTPCITGVIALAHALNIMAKIGFDQISRHAHMIAKYALDRLEDVENVTVYGDPTEPRLGAISFNLDGVDHGLAAAVLSDYYGIAVRNECFCAHPYVRSLLKQELWELNLEGIPEAEQENYINRKRGMVRASFALYTTQEDIDYLISSIKKIINNYKDLSYNYDVKPYGYYQHKTFKPDWRDFLVFDL